MDEGSRWGTELGGDEPEGKECVPPKRKTEARKHPPVPAEVEAVATQVVDAAFKVHATLGPGLVEAVYEACLCRELAIRKIPFKSQVSFPVTYEGVQLDAGQRLDLVVADCVIVEIKAVEQMNRVFEAQLLTYLKLTGRRLGLLINFNSPLFRDGIRRMIR